MGKETKERAGGVWPLAAIGLDSSEVCMDVRKPHADDNEEAVLLATEAEYDAAAKKIDQCKQWREHQRGYFCMKYHYDFFGRDWGLEDIYRYDNQAKYTYGFCSRGWVVTLLVLEAIMLMFVVFLLFATVVKHIRDILCRKGTGEYAPLEK
eukprot:NODE_2007_length_558_cov_1706.125737_g980_i13.p1 GENE.NODE_2007_length_558_cov_1706.125737_g980_i13~~NODE_2007_length_558_cov_1706.125737_g980_i13.p1  ORF type:complete len:159 (+),score=57.68 NODE_2007_length_558_cov_1706.125737_g980_i13:26-478(+)